MENKTHKPGDRWQHAKWPEGTPDAVVGEVIGEPGSEYLRWAELGGSQIPGISARFLTEENGWRRA